MNHASLFSGIGGFDLASEWIGWENVLQCEKDEFCQRVLKHYWPKAILYGDIKTTDFKIYGGQISVLSGGFPCQDASNALQTGGGQKGIEGNRTGLFWEMLRAIDEIKPKYIVAENVANILKINKGKDFGIILAELARMGYNAEWRISYASEVGAPHQRARLYLVAYPNSLRIQRNQSFFSLLRKTNEPKRRKIKGTNVEINADNEWLRESPVYCLDDGFPTELDILSKSIKGYGNAIVPQIAYELFKVIDIIEKAA